MPLPEHASPPARDQNARWLNPAIGCFAIVLMLFGACWACESYFAPSILAAGRYKLTIEGDMEGPTDARSPRAWAGRAELGHSGRWEGRNYYSLSLKHDLSGGGMVLRTLRKPRPGTFAILSYDRMANRVPNDGFDGFISLTYGAGMLFRGDSGTVVFRKEPGFLVGELRMYASMDTSAQTGGGRHVLVTGNFMLR
jgi:hypothetical protein